MTSPSSFPAIAATRRTARSGSRAYEIDGESYPSVTTILGVISKPALVTWAANQERTAVMDAAADLYLDLIKAQPMSRTTYLATLDTRIGKTKAHQRASQKALEIGSQAHQMIEHQLRKALGQTVGPEPRIVDEALWAYMAFEDWARAHEVRPVHIEQVVYSRTYRYAGTMDLLAYVDGELALVDFKTSKGVYAEYHLQTAAYRHALNEMGHGPVTNAYIVRLPKVQTDPAFEAVPSPSLDVLLPVFVNVIGLYRWHAAAETESLAKWKARKDAEAREAVAS